MRVKHVILWGSVLLCTILVGVALPPESLPMVGLGLLVFLLILGLVVVLVGIAENWDDSDFLNKPITLPTMRSKDEKEIRELLRYLENALERADEEEITRLRKVIQNRIKN